MNLWQKSGSVIEGGDVRTSAMQISIIRDLPFLLREGWEKIRRHDRFLLILWAVFYIPTNFFTYFRLEPYLEQADILNFRGDVAFAMLLLNILGYIPMIAIALLMREESDEYDGLVMDAFRHLPFFITTSLAMAVRIVLPVLGLFLPAVFLIVSLAAAGFTYAVLQWILIPYFIFLFCWTFMRYYSSTMFYLMKGIRNFKAARYSAALFSSNRKLMIRLLGIFIVIPLLINYSAVFLVEDSLVYMIVSMIVGVYIYIANGIYANVFHYLDWDDNEESSVENK